ncbi:glucosyltransferase domain-containing protein [Citrobacter freundii]|nr:glucosyltransferase domain-containing protein [Citrobacter freundii]
MASLINKNLKNAIPNNLFHEKNNIVFLCCLTALIIIYVMPIILADRLYIDDILRSQLGYTNWSANGRPLSDLLMMAFSFFGKNIVDLSPLTLIIALSIFSFCALIYYKTNLDEFSPIASALIMFSVIANPFLLENLSYKFDVLPMITSLSILLVPFFFKPKSFICIILSIVMIISSLCLYQASIGFYVCLAIIEYFLSYKKCNAESSCYRMNNSVFRIISLVAAYYLYGLLTEHMVADEYNLIHSQILAMSRESLSVFTWNISTLSDIIILYFKNIKHTTYFIYAVVVCSIVSAIFNRKNNYKQPLNMVDTVIFLLSPVLIVFCTFIHLCFLSAPVFADRVLISFGAVMMLVTICFFSTIKNKYIVSVFISFPLLFVFVYSYTFGAAQKYQKEYDNRISNDIALSVSRADPEGKLALFIAGTQPSSNQRINAVNRFPSLSSLIPLYYNNGWWGKHLIKMFGIKNRVIGTKSGTLACSMKKFEETQIYSLYIDSENILVDFDKPVCK